MKELTMTVVCNMCSEQYGAWRPRCPACGTPIPVREQVINKPRLIDTARQRAKPETVRCAFCQGRKPKSVCDVCKQPVHPGCLASHKRLCDQFQKDVAAFDATA